MKQGIFAVRDAKLEAFNIPFFSPNRATALRSFAEAVNDPSTNLHKYPDDYSLHHIGHWDDVTSEIETQPPTNLGLARDYKHDSAES